MLEIHDHIYHLNVQVVHVVKDNKIYEIHYDQDDPQDYHEKIVYAN
jgi:hypothetical protein